MIARKTLAGALAPCIALLLAASAAGVPLTPELAKRPSWEPPPAQEVKDRALAWLDQRKADQKLKDEAAKLWSQLPEGASELEVLRCLADTFALADPDAAGLAALCAKPKDQWVLPPQAWLTDQKTDPFVGRNMRLMYGRWLVHEAMFDEAVEQLSGLDPAEVVAPATLLFYRSVAYHSLLDKTAGLESIARLLDGADRSPRRYVAVARLMEEDLKSLDDESLDHIARRMDDVRRRLDLGRAGKKVRGVEDGIIESLDKIIKKLEEQQAAAAAAGGGIQDNIRSSSPAPDSLPIGGKGPGRVDRKNIGSESDWGNLPPKEREEALQRIGRDFPPHYRDVIEEYFRRLAAEKNE